jgi:menaquinone-9 beta-reductase
MPDSLEVLSRLGVTLDNCIKGEFRGIRFAGPECSVNAEFPHGRGQGIRRVLLHGHLMKHAEKAGVNTLWQARVRLLDRNAASASGRLIRHKWLVGANGQNSKIRHWAGPGRGVARAQRIALRRHFRVKEWGKYVVIFWVIGAGIRNAGGRP